MPLFWGSLAFAGGIVLGNLVAWPATIWLYLASSFFCSFLISRRINRLKNLRLWEGSLPIPLLVLVAISLLGAYRFRSDQPDLKDPGFIAAYNDHENQVAIVGLVSALPDVRDSYQNIRLQAEQLRIIDTGGYQQVEGLLLARLPLDKQIAYGDRLVLRGWLVTPPEHEDFSYREYLARQNIYAYMSFPHAAYIEGGNGSAFLEVIYAFKTHALEVVYRIWPDPEASLLAGILLGVETGISKPVQDAFRDTGTTHIIAISGFNITIIAGLFASTFGRLLGTRRGVFITGIGISLYTILVGADAAVVRAAIMGCLGLFARQVGRRQHAVNSLVFTGGLMALHNPHVFWDVGFQLSFAATMGLVLYAESFSSAFVRLAECILPGSVVQRLVGPVGEYFLFTLAAQITTLPVMVYHFGRLSLTSLIANPVILPAQPPVMILGGAALLLGMIFLPLGKIMGLFVWPFVSFSIRTVELISQLKGGVWVLGDVALPLVIGYYSFLITLAVKDRWSMSFQRWFMKSVSSGLVLVAVAVGTVVIWRAVSSLPDSRLHVTILDVDGGESLLIESPTGRYVLVNGGPSRTRLSEALGRRLPPIGRELDVLVIASTREEAIAGLVLSLERFPPNQVIWTGNMHASRSSRNLHAAITSLDIPMIHPQKGQSLQLGMGAELEFLWVGDRGSILLLRWGQFRAVFPIGADFDALEVLDFGRGLGSVPIVLLADSGYAPLNPLEWFENIQPNLILLSVEHANDEGLPSREVIAVLDGFALLRTDVNGWIHITTDGERLWVEVEKE